MSSLANPLWQREVEVGSHTWLRLEPDPPAQSLQRFLADGQTNPGTLELLFAVQALKEENPFKVLWLDSKAIVLHRKDPFAPGKIHG